MTRKKPYRVYLFALGLAFLFWLFLLGGSGTFTVTEQLSGEGLEVLANPSLSSEAEGWGRTSWRSAGGEAPTAFQHASGDAVVMGVSGYDVSFYATGLYQGSGPTVFNWGPRVLYVSVNESSSNVVTWKGKMIYENASAVSCLGMGVDFWFDAVFPDGTNKPVEMYIFFYMAGAYKLPVGSFKTTIRQDYNYSSGMMGITWDYVYFHAFQAEKGVDYKHSFELYDYIRQYKQFKPEYRDAEFILTCAAPCMELFMCCGEFTVDYCGLTQQAR